MALFYNDFKKLLRQRWSWVCCWPPLYWRLVQLWEVERKFVFNTWKDLCGRLRIFLQMCVRSVCNSSGVTRMDCYIRFAWDSGVGDVAPWHYM